MILTIELGLQKHNMSTLWPQFSGFFYVRVFGCICEKGT